MVELATIIYMHLIWRDPKELDEMVDKFAKEEEVIVPEGEKGYSYEDAIGKEFKLVKCNRLLRIQFKI